MYFLLHYSYLITLATSYFSRLHAASEPKLIIGQPTGHVNICIIYLYMYF